MSVVVVCWRRRLWLPKLGHYGLHHPSSHTNKQDNQARRESRAPAAPILQAYHSHTIAGICVPVNNIMYGMEFIFVVSPATNRGIAPQYTHG